MDFKDLQKIVKEKFDIDHLADIARELNVSPQAVSNWKSRNKVPYKYSIKLREKINHINKTNIIDDNHLYAEKNIKNIDNDYISLADIFSIFFRQFKIILFFPAIFCLYAFINIIFFTSPIYQSSANIMSTQSSSPSQTSGIAAQLGLSFSTSSSSGEWGYIDILFSRSLAKRLLSRKFDTEKFGNQKSLLQILTYGNSEPSQGLDTLMRYGIDAVIDMIEIENSGTYNKLIVTTFEPVFARDFISAVIEELDSYQREYNKSKTSEARKFVEDRIIDVNKELTFAELELKKFLEGNRRIENSPSLGFQYQRLQREVDILTEVLTTLRQQLETTKIQEVKENDYVIVLDEPEAPFSPSGPNKKRIIFISLILGFGLGILIALLKDYFFNV